MFKRLHLLLVSVIIIELFFQRCSSVSALDSGFDTTLSSIYTINAEGSVSVNQIYTLTNLTSSIYPTRYQINLDSTSISKVQASTQNGESIPYTVSQDVNSSAIILAFPEKNVGKGKTLSFNLSYDSTNLASKKGTSLELNIPKINPESGLFSTQTVIMVPVEYGQPVTISPQPASIGSDPSFTKITFSGNDFSQKGITALFGDKQIYDVSLIFQLQNSTITPVETQIAFPPDTENQRIFLDSIDPPPQTVSLDSDGNWIATYSLKPQESLDVNYHSHIIVYAKTLPFINSSASSLSHLIEEKQYWPVNNSKIQQVVKNLKDPESIYQFVINKLSYKYENDEISTVDRQGALKSLENPAASLCLDYSDLLITLYRSAGIPSKLITGYGISDNPQKKPVSSESTVYHAWVSYYDKASNLWHQVDPTWGDTTGGYDYFSQIGFNHIIFTLHGLDSVRPYSPGFYQKPDSHAVKVEITDKFPPKNIKVQSRLLPTILFRAGLSSKLNLELENQGTVALYNFPIDIAASGRQLTSNPAPIINSLLPYEKVIVPLQFKRSIYFNPLVISTLIYGNSQTYTLKSSGVFPTALAVLVAGSFLASASIFTLQKFRHLLVRRP